MIARMRRFARETLIRLGVIDETFNRAKTADMMLARGVTHDDRPEWLAIESDLVDELRVRSGYAAKLPVRTMTHAVLRAQSVAMRDPLVHAVSAGRFGYREFAAILRAWGRPGSREGAGLLLSSMPFADLVYLQKAFGAKGVAEDADLAPLLLDHLGGRLDELGAVDEAEATLFVSKLIQAGLVERAREAVAGWSTPNIRQRQLRTDVLNPFAPGAINDDVDLWLVALNSMWSRYGMEPIEIEAGEGHAFDRLRAHAHARIDDGPLVSVIMTCFKPGAELWTGVRSTLQQTWTNLELLVMDDGSGPEFEPLLAEVEASDPRVRVIRATDNVGTYVRRNQAIDLARGTYVTMQDSDDWMHPRRLELHARHLAANPALVANISQCFRVSEHLQFSQEHGFKLKVCEPSLFFHKERALASAGYFDTVRKAADGEYRLRLQKVTGTEVERLSTVPALTLQRTLSTSLSTSDFGESWLHASRLGYRSAYQLWHGAQQKGSAALKLPQHPAERPFPSPSRIAGTVPTPTIDEVFLGDAVIRRLDDPSVPKLAERAAARAATGASVGFAQVWRLQAPPAAPLRLQPALQKLLNARRLEQVYLDEVREVGVVHITDPALFQYPPALPATWTVGEVRVTDAAGSGPWARDAVEAGVRHVFGVAPSWVR